MLRLLDRLARPTNWERDWFRGPFFNWDLSDAMIPFADIETIPVNVYTSEDAVRVHMSLPGWEPEWVDLSVEGNRLHIKGEAQEQETSRKTFSRIINLPFRAAPDQVKAVYKNGILTIDLFKSEQDRPKKIEIEAA